MIARLLSFVQVRTPRPFYEPSVLSYFAVIQGAADMGIRLSEAELQNSLDFCKHFFNPTTHEDYEFVAKSVGPELLDVDAPIVDPAALERVLAQKRVPMTGEKDAGDSSNPLGATETLVLNQVNARRLIHHGIFMNNIESEPLNDYAVRLERGNLGLVKFAA